ncbi:MAG: hypothetical protein KAV48_07795 [Methanomicrobia archaeon]|nr:hypothetical protein [Methanomicrobia archaeon]MCK4636832.1 hypothetical protein [Methanomicrobia archaeon]
MISIIHALVYIEVQSNEESMVRPALEKALNDITNAGIEVLNNNIEDVIEEEGDIYSSVLEIEIKTDLKKYVKMVMIYSPTSIHVLEGKVVLEKKEFLEILGDVSNITRKLMKDFDVMFQVLPAKTKKIIDEEREIPVTIFCEVKGDEEKIKKQAEFVFADSRAYIDKMKMRKTDKDNAILAVEGYFPDTESIFEIAARITPIAFATDIDEIELSMRDIQFIGMSLSSLTSEIAIKKISMSF